VAKVLQNLFNFSTFTDADKHLLSINEWITKAMPAVTDYFADLVEVTDPEEQLQVDKYMELTQKTKPVIIVSLNEIVQTHQYLVANVDKLTKDKEDPLRLILADLGEVPKIDKEDDREIQLTLTNRFKMNVEEEISASASLYAETKEAIITVLRQIPIDDATEEHTLTSMLAFAQKYADSQQDKQLQATLKKIGESMKSLETEGLITKSDEYAGFLRDIALEVANRAEVRLQQKKEIKRLTQTLKNLRKHQKYLDEQIEQYNNYLQDARRKHYQPKKKGKKGAQSQKLGPYKFTYAALAKKGVIIDSDVPVAARKKAMFYISSENVGEFEIEAKIGGLNVDKITLELDDLLEKNYNNITRLELDQVVLDVNMMIHLINKLFLK